jgi:hypothetical protein
MRGVDVNTVIEVMGALAGVIVGFLLATVWQAWRERKRIRRLKRALDEECLSLVAQIPFLIEVVDNLVRCLKDGRLLSGESVRAMSSVYSSAISDLAPHLSLRERNLLHVAYERLRVNDQVLASLVSEFREAWSMQRPGGPWEEFINKLSDTRESYQVTRTLLKSYLEDDPVDVFYLSDSRPE